MMRIAFTKQMDTLATFLVDDCIMELLSRENYNSDVELSRYIHRHPLCTFIKLYYVIINRKYSEIVGIHEELRENSLIQNTSFISLIPPLPKSNNIQSNHHTDVCYYNLLLYLYVVLMIHRLSQILSKVL